MGHEPVSFPLFEAHHLDLSSADFPSSLPGGLVFTSAEAVRALDKVPAIADRFGDIPVFAVGKATARAACGAGFRTIKVASGYGADLAALIKTNAGKQRALLYFAGEPRSPSLEEGLEQAGIPVHVALTYRMEPVAHSTSRLGPLWPMIRSFSCIQGRPHGAPPSRKPESVRSPPICLSEPSNCGNLAI